jgi:hypothetical protein
MGRGGQPPVRATACWTLGRLAEVLPDVDAAIQTLLCACRDHVKKVQVSALAALSAIITDSADRVTVDMCDAIIAMAMELLSTYQAVSRMSLYDVLGALSGAFPICRSRLRGVRMWGGGGVGGGGWEVWGRLGGRWGER